ncbi:MAG: sterol desaturase family protein [Deltaproteobacteria bacterium]|nr:sterol desaturase family protein [Deltaproteobacteria bacterium]
MQALSSTIGSYGTTLVIIALTVLFGLERLFPLRAPTQRLGHRLLVNGIMSVLTFAVAAFLVRPSAIRALHWSMEHSFGVFHWVHVSFWLEVILSFLLMDLTFYYWHRLNHRVSFLWRFHNVHHVDPDLDASTGFRFHFGEVALSVFFRVVQSAVLGISLPVFILYEFVFQVETYFHHSCLRLPFGLEILLNLFIVTPRMHGIHHSQFHEETDSNFSVIFSFWDRVHKTFRWDIPQSQIIIGVPGYSEPSDNSMVNVLLVPFRKQKDYWLSHESRHFS